MAADEQKEVRMWSMLSHLCALVGFVGIPFGNILGPLVIWLLKKNEIPQVDAEGKESLNFQITMTIFLAIAFLLCFAFVGFLLVVPLVIIDVILVIMASVKVNNGEKYQYPFAFRLIK